MAIEASLRDCTSKENQQKDEEKDEKAMAKPSYSVSKEKSATTEEQIESSGENKYDDVLNKKNRKKTTPDVERDSKKLTTSGKDKHKKKKEKKRKKEIEKSLDNLSEYDLKSQLIESARIKSKMLKHSLHDKPRKKHKKDDSDIVAKEKRRKYSCDVTKEDYLLLKTRKSCVSKERMSDGKTIASSDNLVTGRGQQLSSVTADKAQVKETNLEMSTKEEMQLKKLKSSKSGIFSWNSIFCFKLS